MWRAPLNHTCGALHFEVQNRKKMGSTFRMCWRWKNVGAVLLSCADRLRLSPNGYNPIFWWFLPSSSQTFLSAAISRGVTAFFGRASLSGRVLIVVLDGDPRCCTKLVPRCCTWGWFYGAERSIWVYSYRHRPWQVKKSLADCLSPGCIARNWDNCYRYQNYSVCNNECYSRVNPSNTLQT